MTSHSVHPFLSENWMLEVQKGRFHIGSYWFWSFPFMIPFRFHFCSEIDISISILRTRWHWRIIIWLSTISLFPWGTFWISILQLPVIYLFMYWIRVKILSGENWWKWERDYWNFIQMVISRSYQKDIDEIEVKIKYVLHVQLRKQKRAPKQVG